ncbi:hypothetical protein [Amphritea balenae]|uniref:Uncharacterized protein n=1 Tax=Amphritea balenae TaxID=452629 RepID=A0A3P1SRT1_9GAMM|nr:hypothetical protein [Amphritea balenae]RRC98892.1 hypothetical protein EHS89_11955 [Amphritea balenae]GGK62619.1 hypothetical protein GCM10007941_10950 [Amphritea balenae]
MCSSPKASPRSSKRRSPLGHSTHLSARQQADYATRANAAWERREALRQQQAQAIAIVAQPSLLQQFWQWLLR